MNHYYNMIETIRTAPSHNTHEVVLQEVEKFLSLDCFKGKGSLIVYSKDGRLVRQTNFVLKHVLLLLISKFIRRFSCDQAGHLFTSNKMKPRFPLKAFRLIIIISVFSICSWFLKKKIFRFKIFNSYPNQQNPILSHNNVVFSLQILFQTELPMKEPQQ